MKSEINGKGAELAKVFFGKNLKRKGNNIDTEFDFNQAFERDQDPQPALYMGDELPVYEDELETGGIRIKPLKRYWEPL